MPGKRIPLSKLTVVLGAVMVLIGTSAVARAETASALVLETSGARIPVVQAYDEMLEGTTISLPSGAKLVFLHYHTCRTVAVIGGRIRFSVEKYTIDGGIKESETRTACPRTITLKAGGEMAGALIRSLGVGGVPLGTQPAFLLIGQRADDFASVRVSRGDAIVLESALDGRRFRWPSVTSPLAVDTEYGLVLVPKVAGSLPITMRFKAISLAVEPAGEALTLIRVE